MHDASTPERPQTRCAIYTRQSVARPDQELTSCEVQRETCEGYIRVMRHEGWVLAEGHFDDLGCSGDEWERPGLLRLLMLCQQGAIDAVVVTRLDRLTRSVAHWQELNAFFDDVGVKLIILQGIGAGRGAIMSLVNNILATFAQFELEMISERVREAHAAKRAQGLRSAGRVPYGYCSDPVTKQLVINEHEAPLVYDFFERCADGVSLAEIAKWANDLGYRSKVQGAQGGNPWTSRAVLRILRNPSYLAQWRYEGRLIKAQHEPIVTRDLAFRAWKAIEERRSRPPCPRPRFTPEEEDPYMLRGLIRCAGCDHIMSTSAPAKVTLLNAQMVRRFYECRHENACRPASRLDANRLERHILRVFVDASLESLQSERACGFLKYISPGWRALSFIERNLLARGLIQALDWDPTRDVLELSLNRVNIDFLLEEGSATLGG